MKPNLRLLATAGILTPTIVLGDCMAAAGPASMLAASAIPTAIYYQYHQDTKELHEQAMERSEAGSQLGSDDRAEIRDLTLEALNDNETKRWTRNNNRVTISIEDEYQRGGEPCREVSQDIRAGGRASMHTMTFCADEDTQQWVMKGEPTTI